MGEKQVLKKDSGTYNYIMQADDNIIFVSKSYNCLPFFLQILVFALMTANLWLQAQAQTNPVVTTVLGNGGVSFFSVPQNPQTFLNTAGGGTGVFQGAASGHVHDYHVSTVKY
jgi:hypothetical protein